MRPIGWPSRATLMDAAGLAGDARRHARGLEDGLDDGELACVRAVSTANVRGVALRPSGPPDLPARRRGHRFSLRWDSGSHGSASASANSDSENGGAGGARVRP